MLDFLLCLVVVGFVGPGDVSADDLDSANDTLTVLLERMDFLDNAKASTVDGPTYHVFVVETN